MNKEYIIIDDEYQSTERQRAADYYQRHKEKIKQRALQYYYDHKKAKPKSRRQYMADYYQKHIEVFKCRSSQGFKTESEKNKRAQQMCPTFRYLCDLRANNRTLYNMAYKPKERIVPKTAKFCCALRDMDNRVCSLLLKSDVIPADIEFICPMSGAFKIPGAANQIMKIVKEMRGKSHE